MREFTVQSRILCALVLVAALAGAAFAQEKKHDHAAKAAQGETKFLGKGDGVETCPVTGEAITSKDVKAEFFGRTVYFCCESCIEDVRKNPAAYLKPTLEEQRAAIKGDAKAEGHEPHAKGEELKEAPKFLGKGDGVETCPVTGEPVSKNVKAEINGRTVYACCADCLETIKKNPDLYLKKVEK